MGTSSVVTTAFPSSCDLHPGTARAGATSTQQSHSGLPASGWGPSGEERGGITGQKLSCSSSDSSGGGGRKDGERHGRTMRKEVRSEEEGRQGRGSRASPGAFSRWHRIKLGRSNTHGSSSGPTMLRLTFPRRTSGFLQCYSAHHGLRHVRLHRRPP